MARSRSEVIRALEGNGAISRLDRIDTIENGQGAKHYIIARRPRLAEEQLRSMTAERRWQFIHNALREPTRRSEGKKSPRMVAINDSQSVKKPDERRPWRAVQWRWQYVSGRERHFAVVIPRLSLLVLVGAANWQTYEAGKPVIMAFAEALHRINVVLADAPDRFAITHGATSPEFHPPMDHLKSLASPTSCSKGLTATFSASRKDSRV